MNHKMHRKVVKICLFCMLAVASMVTLLMPISFYVTGLSEYICFFDCFGYAIINLFRGFYIIQFVLASFAIQIRFAAVNRDLKSSVPIERIKVVASDSLSFQVGKVYHKLCDAIDVFNDFLTFPFVYFITKFMVRILEKFEAFMMLKNYKKTFISFLFSPGCKCFLSLWSCR